MPSSEPTRDELQRWLTDFVAPAIEEKLSTGERHAKHQSAESSAILEWIVETVVPANPRTVQFADGPKDGGIDLFVADHRESETTFSIYQVQTPNLAAIAAGRILEVKEKLEQDVKALRNSIGKSAIRREFNQTASEILESVNSEFEDTTDTKRLIRVEVIPVCLKKINDEHRKAFERTRREADDVWSKERPNVRWEVHEPVDIDAIYSHYFSTQPDELPKELRLEIRDVPAVLNKNSGPVLFFSGVRPLLDAYKKYRSGLFDSNLRYYLGRSSDVNAKIRNSISTGKGRKRFPVMNNGLVVSCDNFVIRGSGETTIVLTRPQVINGGQTLVTLGEEYLRIGRIALENRSEEERALLESLSSELAVSVKVVRAADDRERDEIAIASNTQNPLTARTLRSSSREMRELKIRIARGSIAWFLETKDGEWDAIRDSKPLVQSKTKGRNPSDFYISGRKTSPRLIPNSELGIALLSFYGFIQDAKLTSVFDDDFFSRLFGHRLAEASWSRLASERVSWRSDEGREHFCAGSPGPHVCLLSWLLFRYLKKWTLTEREAFSKSCETFAALHPEFSKYRSGRDWNVENDSDREKLYEGTSYWPERIAKGAYLGLVYQAMRLLTRRYGPLEDETSQKVLNLPQLKDLYCDGLTAVDDFRTGYSTDGVVSAISRILLKACDRLWRDEKRQILGLTSLQQDLLSSSWSDRLGRQVDYIVEKLPQFLPDLEVAPGSPGIESLADLLPAIS
jgi:hypothetical protein